MRYPDGSVVKAEFLRRPNRFIAHCLLAGTEVVCHVKNTGRCRELLLPGTAVYLCRAAEGTDRKTEFDLIAVEKGDRLVNMDSQAPNAAAGEFLRLMYPDAIVRAEVPYGISKGGKLRSRVDFLVETAEGRLFVEVKGVTLEENGVVRFPDAPTERGTKHLRELARQVSLGDRAMVLFVIQMGNVRYFSPNDRTDPAFSAALREAAAAGVEIAAYDCTVTPDSMTIGKAVPVLL